MNTGLNIKQAEQATGIARQNIRFYEKQGLLAPARNRANAYRQYSAEDVRTLKLIRALRMLDMPLEDIRAVLNGVLPLAEAAGAQQQRLEARARELDAAIRCCGVLRAAGADAAGLDVDGLLARMETPPGGYFSGWAEDWRRVARAAHQQQFVFYPDGPVTNPREFTDALFAYAKEHRLDLVLTREGMYPEFTVDGTAYTAERNYKSVRGIPVACVRCTPVHPEQYEADVPPARRRLLKLAHYGWPALAILAFLGLTRPGLFSLLVTGGWEGWFLLAAVAVVPGASLFRAYLFHYNENGRPGRK